MSLPSDSPSFVTLSEIMSQPEAWQVALRALEDQRVALDRLRAEGRISDIVFTGCGSPFFLCRTAAALWQGLTGHTAFAYPASEFLLFPQLTLTKSMPRTLVVVSRSGETTEALRAVEAFRRATGGLTLAVTCVTDSSLARLADVCLALPGTQEEGLAQTRSFTAMLLATQGLLFALAGHTPGPAFVDLPSLGADLLRDGAALAERLGTDLAIDRIYFLGSGLLYGVAGEAMIKTTEMSLSHANAYHFFEFRHGPMSMVNPQTLIVGFVSASAHGHEAAVLAQMRQMGARVLALTPVALDAAVADEQVLLPGALSDEERGPLYLPLVQLMVYHRAVSRGLNPDTPRHLSAVIKLSL